MTRPFIDYTPLGLLPPTDKDLQSAIYRLMGAWRALDAVRDVAAPVRPERAMKPAPGPRAPTSVAVIDLIVEVEERLRPAVVEACISMAAPRPRKGIPTTVVGLLATPHLWDEMSDPMRGWLWVEVQEAAAMFEEYVDKVQPSTEAPPAKEPRLFAWQVVERLAGMGHRVSEDQLRQWRSRSVRQHITDESVPVITAERARGKNTYLLTEVLDYMGWKDGSSRPSEPAA